MVITVTMKTPDAVRDAIDDAVQRQLREFFPDHDWDSWNRLKELPEDIEAEKDALYHEARRLEKKYFRYGEYVTIQMDTETGEATVVPQR